MARFLLYPRRKRRSVIVNQTPKNQKSSILNKLGTHLTKVIRKHRGSKVYAIRVIIKCSWSRSNQYAMLQLRVLHSPSLCSLFRFQWKFFVRLSSKMFHRFSYLDLTQVRVFFSHVNIKYHVVTCSDFIASVPMC